MTTENTPAQAPGGPQEAPKTMSLAEVLVAQLGVAWTEYLHVTQHAETAAAMSVMLAGRILRLQEQIHDLSRPVGAAALFLAVDGDDEEEETSEGKTIQ